jgi:hypothetical protein
MRKLRSDITREGLTRTPHRAFMRAMGLDDAAIQKPMIGVVSMKGEQTPCNMTHGFQVEAAKEGGCRGRRHASPDRPSGPNLARSTEACRAARCRCG